MKKGFTLVELLVVVGIMGALATVSTVGYSAATRGMKNRAIRQDVVSFLRQAQQRAFTDNRPVVVFLYDQHHKVDRSGDEGYVQGHAVAVRMEGRISYVGPDKTIADEFADWRKNFDVVKKGQSSSSRTALRLYRLSPDKLKNFTEALFYAHDYVTETDWRSDDLLMSGMTADNASLPASFASDTGGSTSFGGFSRPVGFKQVSGGSGAGVRDSDWMVGDAYGMEIETFDLPVGFLFGSSVPKNGQRRNVDGFLFDPADVNVASGQFKTSVSVQLYMESPGEQGKAVKLGDPVKQSDLKD